MNIKERFTVYKYIDGTYPIRVVDNKTKAVITELEAELICQEEYGQQFSNKTNYISKVLDSIIAQIDLYNESCEKGFEITMTDIITKFRKKDGNIF